ncbi:MAG TPA: cytochrome c biogenesis protein CcdA [Acidimicrobiales bacterium]|nr:cytochrome c biogenesis protein CcdA [Acidimicrobiales bacterium]
MTSTVSYVAAFGGGVASFVSPCVLPIVPGYLSVVTGLDLTDAQQGSRHHLLRIARDTTLFVAGFTVVFVLLGITGATIGKAIFRNKELLLQISGALVIAMALFLAGSLVLKLPALYREARFHPNLDRFGPFAAPIAGAAFGFGWQPCLGPILASVSAVAATTGSAGEGAALLGVYSLGLGIPFLVVGLALARLSGTLAFVRRHSEAITIFSVIVMGAFGVLLFTDKLTWVTSELETLMRAIGLGRLVTAG